MEIIAADEARINELLQLDRECLSPPWTHGQMLSEIYNDDTLFMTTLNNGAVVGFCVLRKIGDEAELFRIATSAEFRREGVATHLLHRVITDAKSAGVEKVFLEVRASNAAAIVLYERFGFKSVGVRRGYYTEPVEDAVVMRLEIK